MAKEAAPGETIGLTMADIAAIAVNTGAVGDAAAAAERLTRAKQKIRAIGSLATKSRGRANPRRRNRKITSPRAKRLRSGFRLFVRPSH